MNYKVLLSSWQSLKKKQQWLAFGPELNPGFPATNPTALSNPTRAVWLLASSLTLLASVFSSVEWGDSVPWQLVHFSCVLA